MKQSKFPYGASYYPMVFPEETWSADLERMEKAGINLIRTNDIHGSWDRLEPQRGNLRLDVLERFYRKAGEHGISILLSTGAATPPLWLANQYPDARLLSHKGQRYPLGSTYHWYCIHHSGYREESERFLDILAGWAVKQPEHFGWQISNELGFPFKAGRDRNGSENDPSGGIDLHCYCSTCQGHFREWLKHRYGSTELLSEAWTWSATTHYYNDWQSVTAPETLPTAWSSVTRWIDWRLFWQDSFAQYVHWQQDLIRRHDADHPTVVNTFHFHPADRFGTLMGLDQWKIAQNVDHIGYDLYPGLKVESSSVFLDHGRSVSRSTGRDFWVPELESGPIGGWFLGPTHNTNDQDIMRYVFECLGHDAKAIIYMPWKEWDYQPIHWGALVDLDGNETSRSDAATRLGRYIHDNGNFFLKARTPQGEIALLDSRTNAILLNGLEAEEPLFSANRGSYDSFWELGNAVDFITPDLIGTHQTANYDAICMPMMASMDDQTAQTLHDYAANGGLVIAFAQCGMMTERGWYRHSLPGPTLGELFGLKVLEVETADSIVVQFQNQSYAGYLHLETLDLDQDAVPLAHFDDGRPAVVLHSIGRGHGLYFATQADAAYTDLGSLLLKDVLRIVLQKVNIQPKLLLEYTDGDMREIDPHLLIGESRATVLIVNYSDHNIECTLNVGLDHPIKRVESGLEKKADLPFTQTNNRVSVPLNLARNVAVEAINILW